MSIVLVNMGWNYYYISCACSSLSMYISELEVYFTSDFKLVQVSQTPCYCLSQKAAEVRHIQERLFSKIFCMCSLGSSWLLVSRPLVDRWVCVLHSWHVEVLPGVPFIWESRVRKGTACLQGTDQPLQLWWESLSQSGWDLKTNEAGAGRNF